VCVCVCVRACARARTRARVRVRVNISRDGATEPKYNRTAQGSQVTCNLFFRQWRNRDSAELFNEPYMKPVKVLVAAADLN